MPQGDEGRRALLTTKPSGMNCGVLVGSKRKGKSPNTSLPAPAGPSHNPTLPASRCQEAPMGQSLH